MSSDDEIPFNILRSILERQENEEAWNFSYWEERYLYLCNAILRCSLERNEPECDKCKKYLPHPVYRILKVKDLVQKQGGIPKRTILNHLKELVETLTIVKEGHCLYEALWELDALLVKITHLQVAIHATIKVGTKHNHLPAERKEIYLRLEQKLLTEYNQTAHKIEKLLEYLKENYEASQKFKLEQKLDTFLPEPAAPLSSSSAKINALKILKLVSLGWLTMGACPIKAQEVVFEHLNPLAFDGAQINYDANSLPERIVFDKGRGQIIPSDASQIRTDSMTLTGQGTLKVNNRTLYKGNFTENRMEGYGTLKDPQSGENYFEGFFENNLPHGNGTFYTNGTRSYKGDVNKGKPQGNGTIFRDDGKTIWYKGPVKDGKPHTGDDEQGTFYFSDGKPGYEGEWRNGTWHGQGNLVIRDWNKTNSLLGPLCQTQHLEQNCTFVQASYNGNFENSKFNGYGMLTINIKTTTPARLWGVWTSSYKAFYKGNWMNNTMKGEGNWTDQTINPEAPQWNRTSDGSLEYFFPPAAKTKNPMIQFKIKPNGTGTEYALSGSGSSVRFRESQFDQNLAAFGYTKEYDHTGKTVIAKGNMTKGIRVGQWALTHPNYNKTYNATYDSGTIVHFTRIPYSSDKFYTGDAIVTNETSGAWKRAGHGVDYDETRGTNSSSYYDSKGNVQTEVYFDWDSDQRVNKEDLQEETSYRKEVKKGNKYERSIIRWTDSEDQAAVIHSLEPLFYSELDLNGGYKWHGFITPQNTATRNGTLSRRTQEKDMTVYVGEVSEARSEGTLPRKEGNGTTYYENGQVEYDGQFKKDKRHGFGFQYNQSGFIMYEGNWEDDMRHGNGTEHAEDGTVREGKWKEGKKHGEFEIRHPNGHTGHTTVTNFEEGKENGQFTTYDTRRVELSTGTMRDGKWHGVCQVRQQGLGLVNATWAAGSFNNSQDCWINLESSFGINNDVWLRGPCHLNSANEFELVENAIYLPAGAPPIPGLTVPLEIYESINSYPAQYITSSGSIYSFNTTNFYDHLTFFQGVSTLNHTSSQNTAPIAESECKYIGRVYVQEEFYTFCAQPRQSWLDTFSRIFEQVSEWYPIFLVPSAALFWEIVTQPPLPELQPQFRPLSSFYGRYLATIEAGRKYPQYVKYLRSRLPL